MNNWTVVDTSVEESLLQTEDTDVAEIARELRALISRVPGATFSVRINRQWAKSKTDPKSLIYVEGAIKFWGGDYTAEKQEKSNLMLQGILKDVSEEYQLDLNEGMYAMRYHLVQHH